MKVQSTSSSRDMNVMPHGSIFSEFIPNKTITCDNRDPPWMTASLKSAN